MRMVKLRKIFDNRESQLMNSAAVGFLKMGLQVGIVAHVMCSGWFFISTIPDSDENNWVKEHEINDSLNYLTTLYWAFTTTTTVGFGDIVPVSTFERFCAIFAMLVGAVVFGYLVGNITIVMENYNIEKTQYRLRMDTLIEYLQSRQLPADLIKRVRTHFDFFFQKKGVFEENVLLKDLYPSLKANLMFEFAKKRAICLHIFSDRRKQAEVMMRMKPCFAPKGTCVFEAGEVAAQIYFVSTGQVRLMVGIRRNRVLQFKHFRMKDSGTTFGAIGVLSGTPRAYSATAALDSELWYVTIRDIVYWRRFFPEIIQDLEEISKQGIIALEQAFVKFASSSGSGSTPTKGSRRRMSAPVTTEVSRKLFNMRDVPKMSTSELEPTPLNLDQLTTDITHTISSSDVGLISQPSNKSIPTSKFNTNNRKPLIPKSITTIDDKKKNINIINNKDNNNSTNNLSKLSTSDETLNGNDDVSTSLISTDPTPCALPSDNNATLITKLGHSAKHKQLIVDNPTLNSSRSNFTQQLFDSSSHMDDDHDTPSESSFRLPVGECIVRPPVSNSFARSSFQGSNHSISSLQSSITPGLINTVSNGENDDDEDDDENDDDNGNTVHRRRGRAQSAIELPYAVRLANDEENNNRTENKRDLLKRETSSMRFLNNGVIEVYDEKKPNSPLKQPRQKPKNWKNNSRAKVNNKYSLAGAGSSKLGRRRSSNLKKFGDDRQLLSNIKWQNDLIAGIFSGLFQSTTFTLDEDKSADRDKNTPRSSRGRSPSKGKLQLGKSFAKGKLFQEDDNDGGQGYMNLAPKELWKRYKVVHPQATLKMVWDLMLAVLIMYSLLVAPFFLGFDIEQTGHWSIIEAVLEGIFIFDVIVNFFTAYQEIDRNLVFKKRQIALRYLKTWFVVDLLSSIPFTWIDLVFATSSELKSAKLFKSAKLLRLFKLLRVVRLGRVFRQYEKKIHMKPAVFRMIKLLMMMCFIAHLNGCLWHAVGHYTSDSEDGTWMKDYCIRFQCNIDDLSLKDRYIISVYWAFSVMTTVGFGEITPNVNNKWEIFTALVSLMVGTTVFAHVISGIMNLVTNFDQSQRLYKQKMAVVDDFMRTRQIEGVLHNSVRNQQAHVLFFKSVFDEEKLFDEMPTFLRRQVVKFCYAGSLYRMPLIRHVDSLFRGFICEAASLFQPIEAGAGDKIIRLGQLGREMYFVSHGEVDVFDDEREFMKRLDIGDYFGENSLFIPSSLQYHYGFSITAHGRCQLLSLSRVAINYLKDICPYVISHMETMLVTKRKQREWETIHLKRAKESSDTTAVLEDLREEFSLQSQHETRHFRPTNREQYLSGGM
eukprot:TRINITY_DN1966_c1_g2_i3.p1 TRINITY_DN1966_c1_g2~~TRINITY_DN1966_c1_g2_i3.p1  ORF type:complete len:1326 (+),score=370.72 TRINITY_DN1966_c1_g2_i3:205-4182(+)